VLESVQSFKTNGERIVRIPASAPDKLAQPVTILNR